MQKSSYLVNEILSKTTGAGLLTSAGDEVTAATGVTGDAREELIADSEFIVIGKVYVISCLWDDGSSAEGTFGLYIDNIVTIQLFSSLLLIYIPQSSNTKHANEY